MGSEILIYQTEDGSTRIEVRLESENVWLTQSHLCELYQKSKSSISEHIKEIFKEGELEENRVVRKFRTTAADGKYYNTAYYNLDVIISVGYRVKSHRGTQFRMWATQRLSEYLIKGFTLDDERLKSGNTPNYFQELLDRIRDIRSSERLFYQKVKDIYATSIDYDPKAEVTQKFF
ncbi:MAG: RhuM family protein, partial [Bacteroidota bacterium]|nr:RhuM family protein [Bacteroidota bacterium]